MFYYLYEIRNNLNGKIYVGVHKTRDMNDGYMGSGKVITSAIAKHGADNFTKVILETFENSEAMYAREKEVVNDMFLLREDVYNLRRGGYGGFDHINKTGLAVPNLRNRDTQRRTIESQTLRRATVGKTEQEKAAPAKISGTIKKKIASGDITPPFTGRTHSILTKCSIGKSNSIHQAGEGNSQFGTKWVTNLATTESFTIPSSSSIPTNCVAGRNKKEIICPCCQESFVTKRTEQCCSKLCSNKMIGMASSKGPKVIVNKISVIVDNIEYASMSEAARELGIGVETARKRFYNDSFPTWIIKS